MENTGSRDDLHILRALLRQRAAVLLPDVLLTALYQRTYHVNVKGFHKIPFSADLWRPVSKLRDRESERESRTKRKQANLTMAKR